ncbi:right-handed parallel beta-helix repeat-containing protein [Candidatus Bipolaricaulota bacterium]|nr:right-handed parallel beta-helix repeat-containing protein [Candidatus Bipolaricaulota bacterium]
MKKRIGSVLILSVLLTLSLGVLAFGAQLNVPDQYETIQAAVDAASSGDEIFVAAGTYEEDVLVSGKSGLTFTGEEGTVLNGSLTFENTYNMAVSGFEISNPEGSGIMVRGVCAGLEITDNFIIGNKENGIDISGDTVAEDVIIKGNDVSENGKDGVNLAKGREVTIEDNVISHNGQEDARGTGIRIGGDATDVVIENNEVVGNAFANIHPQS